MQADWIDFELKKGWWRSFQEEAPSVQRCFGDFDSLIITGEKGQVRSRGSCRCRESKGIAACTHEKTTTKAALSSWFVYRESEHSFNGE